jgi:hypothetical protein
MSATLSRRPSTAVAAMARVACALLVTACWTQRGPAATRDRRAGEPPAGEAVPALGPSPCPHVRVRDMAMAGVPTVPLPGSDPMGGTTGADWAWSGMVAGRLGLVTVPHRFLNEPWTIEAFAYDLKANHWSRVGSAPAAKAQDLWIRAFPVGDRVVVTWAPRGADLVQATAIDFAHDELREVPLAGGPSAANWLIEDAGGVLVAWPAPEAHFGGPYDFARGVRFDMASWRWRPLSARGAPSGRVGESHVAIGPRVFVWGGQDDNHRLLRDGAVYDATRDAWTAIDSATAPSARYAAPAFGWRDRVLVWGGQVPETPTNRDLHDAWIYDLQARRWHAVTGGKPPSTQALNAQQGAMAVGRYVAIVIDAFAPAHAFDLATERWEEYPQPPASVRPPAASRPRWPVRLGDRAVGWLGSQGGPALAVLDLADRTWCVPDLGTAPALAAGALAAYWDGAALAVWGALDPGPTPSCPAGAPCARYLPRWTGQPIGSIITW